MQQERKGKSELKMYHVSSSPHVKSKLTTKSIMGDVIIALLPPSIFGIINYQNLFGMEYGIRSALLILLSVAACVISEYIFDLITKRPSTIGDLSAVVTGMILALNLPCTFPYWKAMLGGAFAIIIVKQLFGGLGQNFMNPALGARCFLLICFAGKMTYFVYDGVTGPTPLAELKAGETVNTLSMLLGNIRGTIGELSLIHI